MAPTLARIAFCMYLYKFTGTDAKKKWWLWGLVVTQLLVNIMTMLQVLAFCQHFASLWDPSVAGRCASPMVQEYIGFFQGAWNAATDLVLTMFPFVMLRGLNMNLSTKAALLVIMSLSIFAMAACIVKTIELKNIGSRMDYTFDTSMFAIWFTVETYVVIIIASVPTLRPVFLYLARQYGSKVFKSIGRSSRTASGNNSSSSAARQAVKLHGLKPGEPVTLEPPGIHPPLKHPPAPGTIRRTVSIHIYTENRTPFEGGSEDTPSLNTVQSSGGYHNSRTLDSWRTPSDHCFV